VAVCLRLRAAADRADPMAGFAECIDHHHEYGAQAVCEGCAGPNKHIVMVLDQAGWHTSKKLVLPEGIHVVHLPSHTPELQPAERLWPFVKEAVANRCMPDLDTLEELVVERCDELTRQPQTIRSQTHFHWWPTV
jgi:hypothetical protein